MRISSSINSCRRFFDFPPQLQPHVGRGIGAVKSIGRNGIGEIRSTGDIEADDVDGVQMLLRVSSGVSVMSVFTVSQEAGCVSMLISSRI